MSRTPHTLLPGLRIATVLSAMGLIAGYVVLAQRHANPRRPASSPNTLAALHGAPPAESFAPRELRLDDITIAVPPGADSGSASRPGYDELAAVMDIQRYRRNETMISTTKSVVTGPVFDSLFMDFGVFSRPRRDMDESPPFPNPPAMIFSTKRIDLNAQVVSSVFRLSPTPPPTVMPGVEGSRSEHRDRRIAAAATVPSSPVDSAAAAAARGRTEFEDLRGKNRHRPGADHFSASAHAGAGREAAVVGGIHHAGNKIGRAARVLETQGAVARTFSDEGAFRRTRLEIRTGRNSD